MTLISFKQDLQGIALLGHEWLGSSSRDVTGTIATLADEAIRQILILS